MSRRIKPLPVLEGVTICDVGAEGNAIAKVDGMVLFVPFAAPGDVVDVRLRKKKKSYAEGTVLRLVEAGPVRMAPICEHFTVCGGCRWQHLPYDFQLKCKQQQVVDACDVCIEIPQEGTKHSLNVAVSSALAIWHFYLGLRQAPTSSRSE